MSSLIINELKNHLKVASFRRNIRIASILGLTASGGIFGLNWLIATSSLSFISLLFIRVFQLRSSQLN